MSIFRRRSEDHAPENPGTSLRGVVLLDNTMVFGAKRAFQWDRPLPREMPVGVDLRSLMDVLESIVLFNDVAVDSSSRPSYAWPELMEVSKKAGEFFRDSDILSEYFSVDAALLFASAEKVRRLVISGGLVRELGFLPSRREIDILPPFYRDSDQFVQLTMSTIQNQSGRQGEPYEHSQESLRLAEAHLNELIRTLDRYSGEIRNFAFFAFRGFYYQDLAHLISASYLPHSWRSGLIRSQLDNPSVHFTDFVRDETGKVRKALESRINHEFGAATLWAEFPPLASFIIGQADKRDALLDTAVTIRQNAKATAFRNWIYDIESRLSSQRDLVIVSQAQDELRDVVRDLERELRLTKKDKQEVKLKFGVPVASAETTMHLPKVSTGWVERVLKRSTHLVFLRELARESTRLAPFALAFQQLSR